MTAADLKAAIRSVPDFPKKGIIFRDITTLLNDPVGFRLVIDSPPRDPLRAPSGGPIDEPRPEAPDRSDSTS